MSGYGDPSFDDFDDYSDFDDGFERCVALYEMYAYEDPNWAIGMWNDFVTAVTIAMANGPPNIYDTNLFPTIEEYYGLY